MPDNCNTIVTTEFSSLISQQMYRAGWPDEPATRELHAAGRQCGGCSYYAPFDTDWGLCTHPGSRHRLETVFEHFTCPAHVDEGWGPHSFTDCPEFHCRCHGEPPVTD
jgi:hypothetical protein